MPACSTRSACCYHCCRRRQSVSSAAASDAGRIALRNMVGGAPEFNVAVRPFPVKRMSPGRVFVSFNAHLLRLRAPALDHRCITPKRTFTSISITQILYFFASAVGRHRLANDVHQDDEEADFQSCQARFLLFPTNLTSTGLHFPTPISTQPDRRLFTSRLNATSEDRPDALIPDCDIPDGSALAFLRFCASTRRLG